MPAAYDDWIADAAEREALWRRRFDRVLGGITPGRLLDVGAGIGTFLAIARDHGWTVEGTEVSSTAIDHAARRYGIALELGMLGGTGLTGPYDAISLWHVLEHIPDPRATIRRCRELLVDGGLLVMAMPNDGTAAWLPTALANAARSLAGRSRTPRYEQLRPGRESHIQHFAPATIRRLLAEEGFRGGVDGVDDAAPRRSRRGALAYNIRRLLTVVTPWNFGREMLLVASTATPRVAASAASRWPS
jgi:SAM-dependent methyltransferase